MERVFQIASLVTAAAAGYFFWIGKSDYTFVAIVLACLAFFLSIRFQVKERNRVRAAEREAASEPQSNS